MRNETKCMDCKKELEPEAVNKGVKRCLECQGQLAFDFLAGMVDADSPMVRAELTDKYNKRNAKRNQQE